MGNEVELKAGIVTRSALAGSRCRGGNVEIIDGYPTGDKYTLRLLCCAELQPHRASTLDGVYKVGIHCPFH